MMGRAATKEARMDAGHVLTETVDGILRIVWNRPDKKNALTGAMYAAYDAALARAAEDDAVRVVLVTGQGPAFTSGNDLQDFGTWGQYADVEQLPVIRAIRRTLAFPKPLVAAVRGPAVGFGTTLLLHCDAVVAGGSATFAMPFTRLGLVPEFGSTYVLPLLAGRVRAAHHLLLGEPFGCADAQAMGLVSAACEDEGVDAKAMEIARKLAALPPATLRTVKALIDAPERRAALEAAIAAEVEAFVAGLRSPEHAEAVRAFMEKRPPRF
jgi:enoyl-CoA hydratase/carnithine racemase